MMRPRPFLLLGALSLSASVSASGHPVPPGDTLRDQAILFLEKHLNDLRDIHGRIQAFTSAFVDESARHPCDICQDRTLNVDVSKYAFEAEQAFPDRFEFTHEVHRDRITLWKLDKNEYRFTIPYTKRIPASPLGAKGGHRPDLGRPSTVELIAHVKYLNGHWGIETVERVPRPENLWMVELAPLMASGAPEFDEQPGFAPDVRGSLIKVGIVHYFNPFSPTNPGHVWLKTGLRVAMRTTELTSEDLVFERMRSVLTEVRGADDQVLQVNSTIDVRTRAAGINETVRSTALEVPIGLSKRVELSERMDLSLEAEVSYSFELTRSIEGDYVADRIGSAHAIDGDTMQLSGGVPAVYEAPPAAVRDAASGEVIDFYTSRTSLLDNLALDRSGYLSFGFLPSLFIRKNGTIKYNIGLRFQLVGNPHADGTLNVDHFTNTTDDQRPAMSSLTSSTYSTFLGLTLGLSL